mmetsp:Transcript_538/g.1356  ORF Transcript_538/g.1356 Transcript_538/m.1356 type:complete len:569 (-) Transcript_538:1514-3220(-)
MRTEDDPHARRSRVRAGEANRLDRLPRFLVLHCLSFLASRDVGRGMAASKEMLYLLAGLERCASGMAVESAENAESVPRALSSALDRLPARPQFAVAFFNGEESREKLKNFAQTRLPPGCTALAAQVFGVQSCVGGEGALPDMEKVFVVEMGSFPDAVCTGFRLDHADAAQSWASCEDTLARAAASAASTHGTNGSSVNSPNPSSNVNANINAGPNTVNLGAVNIGLEQPMQQPEQFWRVFVVLVCGTWGYAVAPTLIAKMQDAYPGVTVIGGVCSEFAQFADGVWTDITNGIGVLAFGGNVPLRTCVSLGLEQVSPVVELETGLWTEDGISLDVALVKTDPQTYADAAGWFMRECTDQTMVGIKFPGESGFSLCEEVCMMMGENGGQILRLVLTDPPRGLPVAGTQLAPFCNTHRAATEDLTAMLDRLQAYLARNDEKVLTGIMFSCAARGPQAFGNPPRPMLDATEFQKRFHVPLAGFYAGGEIGPRARALVKDDVFETSRAVVQGFTVVFGVFIVPKATASPIQLYGDNANVSDSLRDTIKAFLSGQNHLCNSASTLNSQGISTA